MDDAHHARPFRDRADAGRILADDLADFAGRTDVIVLALPRGGVPVAFEVARALAGHPELAMGAIASGGVHLLNEQVVRAYDVTDAEIDAVVAEEERELERRERSYREGRAFPSLEGRTVILIDDGLATGASMRAAVLALREKSPAWIVVAVPVAAAETCDEFRDWVDDIVCAETPDPFYAVGLWYEDFSQTTDEEVHDLLRRASDRGVEH